jgi:hypothetical protein
MEEARPPDRVRRPVKVAAIIGEERPDAKTRRRMVAAVVAGIEIRYGSGVEPFNQGLEACIAELEAAAARGFSATRR